MAVNAQKLMQVAQARAVQRVTRACIFLQGEIRQLISIPSRTVTIVPTTTWKQAMTGNRKTILGPRGSNRSKPGEPPHKDYGTLRSSITWEVKEEGNKIIGRVGSPLDYAFYLEMGTSKMAPRPFLRRSLDTNRSKIQAILAGR